MIKCRLLGHKYKIVKFIHTKFGIKKGGDTDGRFVLVKCERCGLEDAYLEDTNGKIHYHKAPWYARKYMKIDEERETVTGQPRVEGDL